MISEQQTDQRRLPGLVTAGVSVGIIFHLVALLAMVLSARTGPWSVRYLRVPSPSEGPMFATAIAQYTTAAYLQPLGLANNYHFESCLTDVPTIYLEVLPHVKGEPDKYPDAQANMWVRHRQRLLVNQTGVDFPFQRRFAEGVPANSDVPRITFFCHPFDAVKYKLMDNMKDRDYVTADRFEAKLASVLTTQELDRYKEEVLSVVKGPQGSTPSYKLTDKMIESLHNLDAGARTSLVLYQEEELQMPKAEVLRPAGSTMIVARSYARYLKNLRGQEVELVREFRHPISPALMFPSMEAPGKLLIDSPMYSLETFYHSFGNGEPKPWTTK